MAGRMPQCAPTLSVGAQNATLTFDVELLSIKKDNPFGKSLN